MSQNKICMSNNLLVVWFSIFPSLFLSLSNLQGHICDYSCRSRAVQNMCCSSWELLSFWFKSRHYKYLWGVCSYCWYVHIHLPQSEATVSQSITLSSFLFTRTQTTKKDSYIFDENYSC